MLASTIILGGGRGAIAQDGKAWYQNKHGQVTVSIVMTINLKWSQRQNVGILCSCIKKAPKWKEVVASNV